MPSPPHPTPLGRTWIFAGNQGTPNCSSGGGVESPTASPGTTPTEVGQRAHSWKGMNFLVPSQARHAKERDYLPPIAGMETSWPTLLPILARHPVIPSGRSVILFGTNSIYFGRMELQLDKNLYVFDKCISNMPQ